MKRVSTLIAVMVVLRAGSLAQAEEPLIYVPFDGSVRAVLLNGETLDGTIHGRTIFADGIVGQGLKVQRHAYDQVTAVEFEALPVPSVKEGTVAFWFKPNWDGQDGEVHRLLMLRLGREFRMYLVKNAGGRFDYSVVAPTQTQILAKCDFEPDKWRHIALTWDLAGNRTAVFIDGKMASGSASSKGGFVVPSAEAAPTLWLGSESADRFNASVGDGVYDELKLFDVALPETAVQALMLGNRIDEDARPVDLTNVTAPTGSVKGLDAAEVVLFQETRPDGPTHFDPAAEAGSFSLWFKLKEREYRAPRVFLTVSGDVELALAHTGPGGQVAATVDGSAFVSKYALAFDELHHVAVSLTPHKRVELTIDGALQLSKPCTVSTLGRVRAVELGSEIAEASDMLMTRSPLSAEFLRGLVRDRVEQAPATAMEQELWRLDDAHRETNGGRSRVCLNGVWRVKPVDGYSLAPPPGPWGLMRVPGSYRSPLYEVYLERDGSMKAEDWRWQDKQLDAYRAGWYQRIFPAPEGAAARRVFLNFSNVVADYARIIVNGELVDCFVSDSPCFSAIPNQRRIDITRLLKDSNTVTVFIDRQWNLWRKWPSINDHHEIALADVWLETGPSAVQVCSVVVFPSYREKSLALRLRIANPEGRRGQVSAELSFTIRGKEAKRASHSFALDGDAQQVVSLTSDWPDPELWDIEHPNLYTLRLDLRDEQGKLLDTAQPIEFGFREFWVENGEFHLNGKVTRLRMWASPGISRMRPYYGTEKGVKQWIAKLKEVGYNATRCKPIRGRESQVGWTLKFAESDRVGFYHLHSAPPYQGVVSPADYRRHIERYLEAFGNHPSILMWYCDFNTCSYAWNQDPAKLNDTDYAPKHKVRQRALALKARETIQGVDPSRVVFHHAGGNFGEVFTSMNYQSMGVPLQEQEDWPKQWAQNHTQPLISIECDFPFWNQFLHFDLEPSRGLAKRQGKQSGLVYLVNEHAARYFGNEAFKRVRLPESDRELSGYRRWHSSSFSARAENFVRIKALLTERIVKAWRGYGVSGIGHFPCGRGQRELYQSFPRMNMVYEARSDIKTPGLKPDRLDSGYEVHRHALVDYTKPLALLESHQRAFAPLLVFLGGAPDDFTNKDHAFYSGEQLSKSIAIVNDRTTDEELRFDWSLTADRDGWEIDAGHLSRTVKAGEIAKPPLEITAPTVYERTPCTLRLMAVHGGQVLAKDALRLQFFPRRPPPEFKDAAVVVYDPLGQTKALLDKAGLPYTELETLDDAAGKRLLIVGKHALGATPPEALRALDASGMIENGLKVVFFEQKQCHLGNLVFERPSQRIAFIRKPGHPIVEGLTDDDFHDWRGGTDTVPAYVVADEFSPHYPRDKWKCGNGGIVAGHMIRKPEYGNFTPIVDCGFNLRNGPLLELRRGRGIVVFCQLDVTHRYGIDPVATQVVENLFAYMTKPLVPLRSLDTLYVGGEKHRMWLERMGADFEVAERLDHYYLKQAHVLICGLGSGEAIKEKQEDVVKFIKFGGGVFVMPGADLSWLPMGIEAQERQVFRALLPEEADPTFDGIANADLYFRLLRNIPVISGGPQWAVKTDPAVIVKYDYGSGAVVVCALDPESIDGLWNKEKTTRVVCKLLSNMHVGLGKGYRFFQGTTYRHNQLGGPDAAAPEAEREEASWSPYIDELDFYDVDAFHNW